jgi:hypothetical protein
MDRDLLIRNAIRALMPLIEKEHQLMPTFEFLAPLTKSADELAKMSVFLHEAYENKSKDEVEQIVIPPGPGRRFLWHIVSAIIAVTRPNLAEFLDREDVVIEAMNGLTEDQKIKLRDAVATFEKEINVGFGKIEETKCD